MYCIHCYRMIPDDTIECPNCGKKQNSKTFSNFLGFFKKKAPFAPSEAKKINKEDSCHKKETQSANIASSRSSISEIELVQAEILMKQLQESSEIINTTTSPKTFFGRLNFSLDLLLELQKYEKYGIFTNSTPTKDYETILGNLEATVNDFIDRVIVSQSDKNDTLKSQQDNDRQMKKCIENLWHSFYEANDYWCGNNMYPHYNGKLYVDSNFQRIEDMLHDLELREINCKNNTPQKSKTSELYKIRNTCKIFLYTSKTFQDFEAKYITDSIESFKTNFDEFAESIRDSTFQRLKEYHTDLVVFNNHSLGCCEECAKLTGRVYSVSGKNTNFPKLPDYARKHGNFHHGCRCCMNYYFEDYGEVFYQGERFNALDASNRPYIDYRTIESKTVHKEDAERRLNEAKEAAAKEFDRAEYEAILEALPDAAPKSFGAYRRMKNRNTTGFQKLLSLVDTVEQ